MTDPRYRPDGYETSFNAGGLGPPLRSPSGPVVPLHPGPAPRPRHRRWWLCPARADHNHGDPMTAKPEGLDALRKPFPPGVVGKLPARGGRGPELDFVGHAAVTDRLLTVDPQWSWEPVAWDENGLPAYDRAGNLWIRLTVLGVTRLGVGDGPDPKQRIGDAIRNAAMRFGVALDLWTKGELESQDPNGGGGDIVKDMDRQAAVQVAKDLHSSPRKAERGPLPPEEDPWASVEVKRPPVATDPKWKTDVTQRIAGCENVPTLRGLWSEVDGQVKAGKVSADDAAELKTLMEEMSADLAKTASVKA